MHTSENVKVVVQSVPPTQTDVSCLVCTNACFMQRFLSVVQLQNQFSPFSIRDGLKTM